jgi:hypothetical protein
LDKKEKVFGGFTALQWESRYGKWKCDNSLKSFFTLKNPHNTSARKFVSKVEAEQLAIQRDSSKWDRNGRL